MIKFIIYLCMLSFASFGFAEVPEHLFLKETPPIQLPNSARYMVYLETIQNPIGQRSPRPFWIEHLEIPLSFLQEDKAENLNQRIHDSMLFTNSEGEKMVRWILNPEDTTYGDQLIENLKSRGLNLERKRYFIGYSTSSRSCIVQDPTTGTTFSIKSSTNQTAGKWSDKKETVRAARAGRLMSDYIRASQRPNQNTALETVSEPLAYYMPEVDQGIIVRQYDHFFKNSQDVKLVPLFAFIHRAEYYASKSQFAGSTQEFIENTVAKMGGVATAELFLNYGIVYNSPHGQNFLVEVDRNEKPTGKLFARDYADSHLFEPLFKLSNEGQTTLAHYRTFTSQSNKILSTESVTLHFGPYHNGTFGMPSWVTSSNNLIESYNESTKKRILQTLELSSEGSQLHTLSGQDSNYWKVVILLDNNNNKNLMEWINNPVYSLRQERPTETIVSPRIPPRTEAPIQIRPDVTPSAIRSCRVLLSAS